MEEELKAYFFQNMYLQGIHAGIQSAHTLATMFTTYTSESREKYEMLHEWANSYETIVVLNGGNSGNLHWIADLLSCSDNYMPWACFCESEDALNGALTNIGIIVPEKYWKTKIKDLENTDCYTSWELEFMEVLQSCRLMN